MHRFQMSTFFGKLCSCLLKLGVPWVRLLIPKGPNDWFTDNMGQRRERSQLVREMVILDLEILRGFEALVK